MGEFAEHPQLAARDRWRDAPTPGGPVRMAIPPVTTGWDVPSGGVPAAGAHTDEILRWLDETGPRG